MGQAPLIRELPSDEPEIIRRVCAGHRDEFAVLVERYKDSVMSMIYRQVLNHAVAEELAQETFVRAYSALKSFKGHSSFNTWLTRISLNVTKNYFSSRRFKEQRVNQEFDPEIHDKLIAHSDGGHSPEELALVSSALADLKPLHRDALTLIFVEGRSYEEASEILEVPVGTVSSRVTKGIELLRTHLGRRNV